MSEPCRMRRSSSGVAGFCVDAVSANSAGRRTERRRLGRKRAPGEAE